jgi:LysM repeat protein
VWLAFIFVGSLAVFFSTRTVAAAPNAQATVTPGGNLLTNPGFESGTGTTGTIQTANWVTWYVNIARPADGSLNYAYMPKWNQESINRGAASQFIYAGNSSQRVINNWDPWYGGVYQVVTAPAKKAVRFTAYVQVWTQSGDWPAASDGAASTVRVGIDPTGGTNAQASTVVWSGGVNPQGGWQVLSVDATVGSGGKATVFISADFRGVSRKNLAAFFDETSLVQISGIKPTATPTPAFNYSVVTTYTVQEGDSLSVIAQRFGVPFNDFLRVNGFKMTSLIVPGQIVQIPSSAYPTYIVQKGDSLGKLARKFNVSYSALIKVNKIVDPNLIYVGQRLIIPVK